MQIYGKSKKLVTESYGEGWKLKQEDCMYNHQRNHLHTHISVIGYFYFKLTLGLHIAQIYHESDQMKINLQYLSWNSRQIYFANLH